MQLRRALQTSFPDCNPARLPGGFDQVGDIAVVGIVPELEPLAHAIGARILALHPRVRVVAKRDGQHEGEYRLRPLRIIAGEERLTTSHRENGILLHLDLAKVYFSVRLAHERARIATLVQPGERMAVLCSGVGPFPLIIGRYSQARQVIGIEKNPLAHRYALHNRTANRNVGNVALLAGDASSILPSLNILFDRILIVLPYGGDSLLPHALDALRPGGIMHFYDMQAKGCHQATLAKVAAACEQRSRRMLAQGIVTCGHCGPTVHRVCLDALIEDGHD
jgi:tRNA (guanine37-N1)-methyltransferase